jgi:Spy/CpxP family protein refolding chaperone
MAAKVAHQEEQVRTMKSTLATAAVLLALVAGIAYAQEGHGMHHEMHGGMGMGMGMGLPLHELNLTQEQHAQIKQIMQAERPAMKPLMQQEMLAHQQLIQLITSGAFDQAKATAIANQEAQTHVQMQVEHAKIASQIYQLLSSDQKAKVADMITKHQQRMQEHMQKEGQEAGPDAQ